MIVIIDHYSQAPGEKGNNRFLYIANMLCDRGYEVEIVTTDFSHIKKQTRNIPQSAFEKLPYKYTMLPEPPYKKNISLQRILSHRVFGRNLKAYLKDRTDIEAIYISVPSLDVGVAAADYCNEHKIPFFVDIQDIWPEAFELVLPLKNITKHVLFPLRKQAKYIYRSATKLLAVSNTYLDVGKKYAPEAQGVSVFLGTDLSKFDQAVCEYGLKHVDDCVTLGYVGTLGASYNIDIVISAVEQLVKKGYKIRFKVLGDGPELERLKQLGKNLPIDFQGRLAYGQMVGELSSCDIAVNPIVHGAAQSIINKHGDYAAAGLPVISTQESPEYRELISQYNCGITCGVDDVQAVADAIEDLILHDEKRIEMGKNSRRMAEELFDRKVIYNHIIDEIEKEIPH